MTRRSALVRALGLMLLCAAVIAGIGGSSDSGGRSASGSPRPEAALPGRVVADVGIASFNAYRHLSRHDSMLDAIRLAGDERVDIIGWQETSAPYFPAVERRLSKNGWGTWQLREPDGPFWLAVSWRRDRYSLVGGEWTKVHGGAGKARTDLPFPPRGYIVVTLRHEESGRLLSVVDTHLNQGIETGDGFTDTVNATSARQHLRALAQLWDQVPGHLAIGTGDFNFDFRDDARARPEGGIWRTHQGHATSSYQVLGLDDVEPTFGSRWIDYIWIADRTLRSRASDPGAGQFLHHLSLDGYASDHRPLVARIRWYAR